MSLQWSKAIYAFGVAICTSHLYGNEKKAEISNLFAEVPRLIQRIAGKSIPLEVSLFLRVTVLVFTQVRLRNTPRSEPRNSRNKADA